MHVTPDPCSLELFTPCAQAQLAGLLGKGQEDIEREAGKAS